MPPVAYDFQYRAAHVLCPAQLRAAYVSVTHEDEAVSRRTVDTVQHIAPSGKAGQHDVVHTHAPASLQDHTVTVAHDEGEHAVPLGTQCHRMPGGKQGNDIGKQHVVGHCHFLFLCHGMMRLGHESEKRGRDVKL